MLSICLWLKNSITLENTEIVDYSLKKLIKLANNYRINSKNSYQKSNFIIENMERKEFNSMGNEEIIFPISSSSSSSSFSSSLPLSVRTVEASWRGCFSYEWYVRMYEHTPTHNIH
jgi:hypothetical protein